MDPSIFGDKGPGFVNNIFGDKGPRFVNQVPTLTLYLNPLTRTQDPQTPICHLRIYSSITGYWSLLNPQPYRSLVGSLTGTLIDPFKGILEVS